MLKILINPPQPRFTTGGLGGISMAEFEWIGTALAFIKNNENKFPEGGKIDEKEANCFRFGCHDGFKRYVCLCSWPRLRSRT